MQEQEGRGNWAIYYTSPHNFIITFSYSLDQQLLGPSLDYNWLVHEVLCTNVSTPNFRDIFVYHHWVCALIYRPLSYPFRSLMLESWGIRQLLLMFSFYLSKLSFFINFSSAFLKTCTKYFMLPSPYQFLHA